MSPLHQSIDQFHEHPLGAADAQVQHRKSEAHRASVSFSDKTPLDVVQRGFERYGVPMLVRATPVNETGPVTVASFPAPLVISANKV